MSDVAVRPRRTFAGFVVLLSLIALTAFTIGLRRANRTTLRGDEVVTLTEFLKSQPLRDLILKGATQQVSPAPLLYLTDLTLEACRERVSYFGLAPQGYMRLPSLVFTTGLAFGAALVVGLKIRRQGDSPLQYFLVLCGLALFLFHPKVFAFAGTERPYGLWTGLWLFFLAWLLARPSPPWVPMIVLTLTAATATAACFQILAVGIALVVVRGIEIRPPKEILKETAILLALPALVGGYYALRSGQATYEELSYGEKVPHFLRFWLVSNLHVWIAGGAMTFLALKRPALRGLAIPPVALTALMVVMPLIFTLSHMKGYTMPSRQYIWTATAVPVACFFAALAWPELKPTRYLRVVAVVAALGVVAGNLYATFSRPLRNDSRELELLEKNSVLMKALQQGRPLGLVYDSLGDIEVKNLILIAEWIRFKYCNAPLSPAFVGIEDANGCLRAVPHPGDRWVHLIGLH